MPRRPFYNVGINRNPKLIQSYEVVVRINKILLGPGLNRVGRGGTYNVYCRGLNQLYNRV